MSKTSHWIGLALVALVLVVTGSTPQWAATHVSGWVLNAIVGSADVKE